MTENHTKYSREVIPDIEESLSKIAAKISNHSVVLDVGCSSGMMGRFLATKKGCVIDGIDIDEQALVNCHPTYRKVLIKNLETDDLSSALIHESYDFIVVADVIEHLIHPDNLLRQLRMLVKPHGTIIFSVPNITHIAASLELLSGHFSYSPNGLLDNTHLRFYSYQNLVAKLASAGFYLWAVDSVHKQLTETEFGDAQTRLFPKNWLETLIASRPDSLVYQWIVSTRVYPCLKQVDESARQKKRSVSPIFTTALYWENGAGAGFNEVNKLPGFKSDSGEHEFVVDFNFQNSGEDVISQVRIDPASEMKSVWIKSAKVTDAHDTVLWQWDDRETQNDLVNAHWANAIPDHGRILCASNDDPQWYPQIPAEALQQLEAGARFSVVMCDDNASIDAQLEAALCNQQAASRQALEARDENISRLRQSVAERDENINRHQQSVAERDEDINRLRQTVAERDAEIQRIVRSHSWIMTKPLRYFRRKLSVGLCAGVSEATLGIIRFTWKVLPLPRKIKGRFRSALLAKFPSVLDKYRNWAGVNTTEEKLMAYFATLPGQSQYLEEEEGTVYVPLLQAPPLENREVKVICFYLPQFHAIPENDAWWGTGFTEWTNVEPAQPQFINHYQPHVPGELGYYNLLEKATQQRQIELAKLYGIEGFCFYFYWFGGTRLLEKPIENYLNDSTLDLPFCLCWANENWSRRWDGLDHEMLIAQQHSPVDDIAFIECVAKYMKDDRYIRIDGKPLLLVYRPGLLPAPRETVARWRNWCRDHGIGEIYLAYTQSFEALDPASYDFDAAIEFPPNNSALINVNDKVVPLRADFEANVYDARVLVERSENYHQPAYKLFRSVCPSWDNTARRKNKGSILINSNPGIYQRWLTNAIQYTKKAYSHPDERLVFVNAWNEWAEGAHLEPDQRYGYAYLEATRMAQVKTSLANKEKHTNTKQSIAIVVHAFYEEVFDEILIYLEALQSIEYVLYVTAPAENIESLQSTLTQSGRQFVLLQVENRGRDVLPFLKIMPLVVKAEHEIVVKVHTKKSLHRSDGTAWRRDLFQDLISEDALVNALNRFHENPGLGILGPSNHIVPMSYYWGANEKTVSRLARRLGVDDASVEKLSFIAGTMFFARVNALMPLLNLSINDDDFEDESGQIDGTLAHAIERLISISVFAAGFDVPKAEVMEYQFVN